MQPALVLGIVLTLSAADLPEVFHENFEKGADHWQPTDPKVWKLLKTERGQVYCQFAQSDFKPPFRSPFNFALRKNAIVSDFVLEAKCQSTTKDYPHRDMVVVFGYQDPAHFHYVHLGKKADDHANQIFIVNNAPRVKISTKTTPGTNWTDGWHHVKVVRRVGDGAIEIYFDDMKAPIMAATDKTFAWGQVGVGSFDDTGNWDDVTLRGRKVEKGSK